MDETQKVVKKSIHTVEKLIVKGESVLVYSEGCSIRLKIIENI